jgi:uncharacterized membrane protein YccC
VPLPRDKAWFRAKTYGWGWGLPSRWEGWAVLFGFVAAMIAGTPLAARNSALFICYCGAWGAVLIAICFWKGEKPRWRWGDDK